MNKAIVLKAMLICMLTIFTVELNASSIISQNLMQTVKKIMVKGSEKASKTVKNTIKRSPKAAPTQIMVNIPAALPKSANGMGKVSSPLIKQYGADAAKITQQLNAKGQYFLHRHGDKLISQLQGAQKLGLENKYLEGIALYGDRFINHINEHKLLYAGGAVLTSFINNPQPYLESATRLGTEVARETLPRVIEKTVSETGRVATETTGQFFSTLGNKGLFLIIILTAAWFVFRPRKILKSILLGNKKNKKKEEQV